MKRIFVPTKRAFTLIDRWEYTKSRGLMCIYKDGLKCKSAWTLKELLNADHTKGDGLPCKEVGGTQQ